MKALAQRVMPSLEGKLTHEEKEENLFDRRELARSIYLEEANVDSSGKIIQMERERRYGTDRLLFIYETINHASRMVLEASKIYADTVESTVIPRLNIIRASKRHAEMRKVEKEVDRLSSMTSKLFIDGSRRINEAYQGLDDGDRSNSVESVFEGLPGKGYLES